MNDPASAIVDLLVEQDRLIRQLPSCQGMWHDHLALAAYLAAHERIRDIDNQAEALWVAASGDTLDQVETQLPSHLREIYFPAI